MANYPYTSVVQTSRGWVYVRRFRNETDVTIDVREIGMRPLVKTIRGFDRNPDDPSVTDEVFWWTPDMRRLQHALRGKPT